MNPFITGLLSGMASAQTNALAQRQRYGAQQDMMAALLGMGQWQQRTDYGPLTSAQMQNAAAGSSRNYAMLGNAAAVNPWVSKMSSGAFGGRRYRQCKHLWADRHAMNASCMKSLYTADWENY
jgi:hypothetical protein